MLRLAMTVLCLAAVALPTALNANPTWIRQGPAWSAWTPARLTCKSDSSCEEAVILWCNGYSRADADHDGIPCETVCSSREEVERIRADIGF